MSLTIELLRFIGSPYAPFRPDEPNDRMFDKNRLFEYSKKNRLPLLYLDALSKKKMLGPLAETYKQLVAESVDTYDAIARISRLLSDAQIEHVVFKSIRPYTSTTVDIDVLIFGSEGDYENAVGVARSAGYQRIVRGPMSTTLRDVKMRMGIDIYSEVAVSHVPYMDKTKLSSYVIETNLPTGASVKTFTCEADLLAIIAHSIIKENMYTLSEYYTYIHYLKKMNPDRLLKLAKETHLETATRTHTSITALLHETANEKCPAILKYVLSKIGQENIETSIVPRNDFRMPHKYHPVTIARCILEISREKKTRNGFVEQITHSVNPTFMEDLLKKLGQHITRETY